ncbi:MAG: hypothetical protein KKH99_06440, partial [Proteobacteria bacterium]|nr:hypothetical protein [Pseudomonadota bacterium]
MTIQLCILTRRRFDFSRLLNCLYVLFILLLLDFFSPESGFAIQQHSHAEGIIVHQIGHFFFLFSML